MESVSALAKPLAQILRQVDSGLKFCKRRLKCIHHKSFSASVFNQYYFSIFMWLQGFSLQTGIILEIKCVKQGFMSSVKYFE